MYIAQSVLTLAVEYRYTIHTRYTGDPETWTLNSYPRSLNPFIENDDSSSMAGSFYSVKTPLDFPPLPPPPAHMSHLQRWALVPEMLAFQSAYVPRFYLCVPVLLRSHSPWGMGWGAARCEWRVCDEDCVWWRVCVMKSVCGEECLRWRVCYEECVMESVWWRVCDGECVIESMWWRECDGETEMKIQFNSIQKTLFIIITVVHIYLHPQSFA